MFAALDAMENDLLVSSDGKKMGNRLIEDATIVTWIFASLWEASDTFNKSPSITIDLEIVVISLPKTLN